MSSFYFIFLDGESGIGKTEFLQEYLRRNPSSVLIEVRLDFASDSLFKETAGKLGVSSEGAIYKIVIRIIEKLKDSGRVLISEEAEYLTRRIHDQTGIPVVLAGLPRLYHSLVSLNEEDLNR